MRRSTARPSAVTAPVTDWVPQSKPIWFTEYGFPSVNRAANQPNVFIDPKSSESFAPYYSNRSVDRVQQRAAIEATEEFWADPANNPVSPVYGGRMVERLFLWTWDARPYPWFPALTRVWSDGENYRLGHWIQGKVGNMRPHPPVSPTETPKASMRPRHFCRGSSWASATPSVRSASSRGPRPASSIASRARLPAPLPSRAAHGPRIRMPVLEGQLLPDTLGRR